MNSQPPAWNRQANDIDYQDESRLPWESAGVEDHHLHPMEPRTFRLTLTKRW